MQIEFLLKSEADTCKIADEIAEQVKLGDVIALYGELGAGKTFFAQAFCRKLGITEYVSSPSFVIINEYEGNLPVAHIDLYRLAGSDELLELGLQDIFEQRITLIEWPQIACDILPENTIHLFFELLDSHRRLKVLSERNIDFSSKVD